MKLTEFKDYITPLIGHVVIVRDVDYENGCCYNDTHYFPDTNRFVLGKLKSFNVIDVPISVDAPNGGFYEGADKWVHFEFQPDEQRYAILSNSHGTFIDVVGKAELNCYSPVDNVPFANPSICYCFNNIRNKTSLRELVATFDKTLSGKGVNSLMERESGEDTLRQLYLIYSRVCSPRT